MINFIEKNGGRMKFLLAAGFMGIMLLISLLNEVKDETKD